MFGFILYNMYLLFSNENVLYKVPRFPSITFVYFIDLPADQELYSVQSFLE